MSLLALTAAALISQSGWTPPFTVLPEPKDSQKYIQQLGDKTNAVIADGEIMTFLCKSDAEKVELIGGLALPMKKVEGTKVWIGQAQMKNWDEAFFSYTFLEGGFKPGMRVSFEYYFGSKAPQRPASVEKLAGTVEEFTIKSEALGEDRKVTVYLPPGAPKNIPVVYVADGQGAAGFANILEPLITAGKVRPMAIVGVHNGAYRGEPGAAYDQKLDFRAREYLKQFDAERYEKHLTFFCDEVRKWAEGKFGFSAKREDRAVQGFSNGGAFAATAAADRPEVYGASLAYSVAAYDQELFKKTVVGKNLPRFFFVAGTLETFIRGTDAAHKIIEEAGGTASLEHYVTGHDSVMWSMSFIKNIQQVFPGEAAEAVGLRNAPRQLERSEGTLALRFARSHRAAAAQGAR